MLQTTLLKRMLLTGILLLYSKCNHYYLYNNDYIKRFFATFFSLRLMKKVAGNLPALNIIVEAFENL